MVIGFCHTSFSSDVQKNILNYLYGDLLQRIANCLTETDLSSQCNFSAANKNLYNTIKFLLYGSQNFDLTVNHMKPRGTERLKDSKTRWLLSATNSPKIIFDNNSFHRIIRYTKRGWHIFTASATTHIIRNLSLYNLHDCASGGRFFKRLPMNITSLDIERSIVNSNFPSMCDALNNNSRLVRLRLAYNPLDQTNLQLLLLSLSKNTTLTSLAIGNKVSANIPLVSYPTLDVILLHHMLETNSTLKTLSIWGDILSTGPVYDISHFADIMQHNTGLTALNVAITRHMTFNALESLVTIPHKNATLRKLHIFICDNPPMTSSTYTALIDAILNNKTLVEYCFNAEPNKCNAHTDGTNHIDNTFLEKERGKFQQQTVLGDTYTSRMVYLDQNCVKMINKPMTEPSELDRMQNLAVLIRDDPNNMLS
jgi:hypothetical protein